MKRAIAVVALLLFAAGDARAQGGAADAALAEKLFEDGRALMANGDYAEACPKLAESNRLDPGVGTLLNLGECYEKLGKTASAWATYREAEPLARRANQKERARHAQAKAEALAPSLSHLVVKVTARAPGQALLIDDRPIAEAAWSTPIPVDPGPHVVKATANGRKPFSTNIDVKGVAARVDVTIPELALLPPTPGETKGPTPPPIDEGATQRTLGWVGIGVGAALLVAGGVFGVIAKSNHDRANSDGHCTDVDCDQRGLDLIDSAKGSALASTILFIAGGVVGAGGAALLLTAPSSPTLGAKAPLGLTLGTTW